MLYLAAWSFTVELLSLIGYQWSWKVRFIAEMPYVILLWLIYFNWSQRWSVGLLIFSGVLQWVRSELSISYYVRPDHWLIKLDALSCIIWLLIFVIGYAWESPFLKSRFGFLLKWLKIKFQDEGEDFRPEYITKQGAYWYLIASFFSRFWSWVFLFSSLFFTLRQEWIISIYLFLASMVLDKGAKKYEQNWIQMIKKIILLDADNYDKWVQYWDYFLQKAKSFKEASIYNELYWYSKFVKSRN